MLTPPGRPDELTTDLQSIFGVISEVIDGKQVYFANYSIEVSPGVRAEVYSIAPIPIKLILPIYFLSSPGLL